jgi:DnaJ-class molecular chaperone
MHEEFEDYYEEEDTGVDTVDPSRINCAFCRGTGVHPATMKLLNHKLCPVCKGVGILELDGSRNYRNHCSRCEGCGREPGSELEPCTSCGGWGIL